MNMPSLTRKILRSTSAASQTDAALACGRRAAQAARVFRVPRAACALRHKRPRRTRAYPRAASVLQPQAYVSLQPVPRGRAFEIAVVAKISPGFHVNAHEPSEEYLIPTKVMADLPPGIVSGGDDLSARSDARVPIFENATARLRRLLHRADETARGNGRAARPQKIGLTVGYQACNQDACLPPTKVPATAELEIAAVDTPAHPANAEIFSPAGARNPQRSTRAEFQPVQIHG